MIGIQEPIKEILRKIGERTLSLQEAGLLIHLLKEVSELPKLDRAKLRNPNTIIILDTWAEAKRHLKPNFLQSYEVILDTIVNFVASKLDYDGFYEGLGNWFLGDMFRRGYQLPNHNRPSSTWWDTIPPQTRERLVKSLTDNFNLYQERCKVIEEKFGDSIEGKQHRQSRFEQFINRVFTDVEREVIAWH